MEFFPPFNEFWVVSKGCRPLAIVLFIVRFLVRALHHAIFEWFNRQLAWRAAPMIRLLQIPVKWVVDNRALSFVAPVAIYCLVTWSG